MDRMADRENLPVEIALLVSLLLHAMAYCTVQYGAPILKLPWLSSLARLVQAVHVQPTPAHPQVQTITFVEVNEPRPQNQPNQGKQSQQFMETDASQVTGEKPKNAQYYSDKSTVAANPNNASGKLRFGLTISLPVKVRLFQASEENSGPTMATEIMANVARFQCTPPHILCPWICAEGR